MTPEEERAFAFRKFCDRLGPRIPIMADAEFEQLLQEAQTELIRKQDVLEDLGVGLYPRWFFDQTTEKLQWLDEVRPRLVGSKRH